MLEATDVPLAAPFATDADYEEARRLHRQHGTTYYFATERLPRLYRQRVHAVYGFVRVPDEWVDNPGDLSPTERQTLLDNYRAQLEAGFRGVRPEFPTIRAFVDVARETDMPPEEPLCFLDAMAMDLTVTRYPTYADLERYMRGSASAVGLMMLSALDVPITADRKLQAMALGEGMQLTNFLRDVGEDSARGRIYLPQEDLEAYGVTEDEIRRGEVSDRFRRLMQFEIARARSRYAASDPGINGLPRHVQKGVRLARILYARILDRIEAKDYDVFSGRVRTSKLEKLGAAVRVMFPKVL